MFNVVAESWRGILTAYSGILMKTDWNVVTKAASDRTLKIVGIICGTVIGIVVIGYLWLLKIYN